MKNNNTLQTVQYTYSKPATFSTTDPFQNNGFSESPFNHMLPTLGNAAQPYIVEGNKHLSEQTMIAIKAELAKKLKTRLGICTAEELNRAYWEMMAIVARNEGTEWHESIRSFAINYLNFLQQQLVNTSQVTMESIDSIVRRPISPPSKSWLKRVFGGSD